MVSNKTMTILTIIAAGLLLWAVILSSADKTAAPTSSAPTYLIQGLDPATIATIEVKTLDNNVTLVRGENGFTVKDKNNYPAATKEINKLISDCLDIKREEQVTDNPDNHGELDIDDEKPGKAVRFLDAAGETITGVCIGKTNADSGGSYVRQSGANAVYVSRNVPYLRSSPTDYVDKTLASVERDAVAKIMVMDGDDSYTLRKDENNVILDTVPAGKQPKTSELDTVFYALQSLELTDVTRDASDLSFDRSFICELRDTTVYTFKIAQKDDKTFVTCSAQFLDQTPIYKDQEKESAEELQKKEAILLARDAAQSFTKKHQGWIYEVASWQSNKLTKKLDDLLEDASEPEPAEEEAEPELEPEPAPATEPDTKAPAEPEPAAEATTTEN